MKFKYDLHVHSVLSGCASRENTIQNILNMAKLCKIDILAITDHNAGFNAVAAQKAAAEKDILLIPGVEVSTSEDIHVLSYFRTFDALKNFCDYLYEHMPKMKFNTNLYFTQEILDGDDNEISCVGTFLGIASEIDLYSLQEVVESFGGVTVPAHVDKETNSMLATLGCVPDDIDYKVVEVSKNCPPEIKSEMQKRFKVISNSDAHTLESIVLNENYIDLKDKSIDAFFELFGK